MEENILIPEDSKFSPSRFAILSIFNLVVAFLLALMAGAVDSFAMSRFHENLLLGVNYDSFSQTILYCFPLVAITSMSVLFFEFKKRRSISLVHYTLIDLALPLFYLLLLSFTEKISFIPSYIIAGAMIAGLIAIFVKALFDDIKIGCLLLSVMVLEFGLMFLLARFESMTLLVGSLSLFFIIALAMYLSLKLKVVNNELIIK